MSGLDDNVVVIGDWAAPSPSPRTFFSAMLGDDIGLRTTQEPTSECKKDGLFLGSQGKLTLGNAEKRDDGQFNGQLTGLGSISDQKSTSRGNLVERMAARAGFNAPRLNMEGFRSADLSLNSDARSSPYLTIPPGLSPTSLLDSPVFLSNSLVQPSPTTGKFPFVSNVGNKNSALMSDAFDRSGKNPFEDSSFAFKPVSGSGSAVFTAGCRMTVPVFSQHTFSETSVHAENSLQPHNGRTAQVPSQGSSLNLQVDLSRASTENESHNNTLPSDQRIYDNIGGTENSSPLDELQDDEGDQKGSGDSVITGCGGAPSEDGYNWRKYGQKQVKGSEFPRSYYKCTHPSCQVKKKVERSHEGHITEIIYKGIHNHPKPPPNRRSVIGGCSSLNEIQLDSVEHGGPHSGASADGTWANMQKATPTVRDLDWRQDNVEVTSSASDDCEFSVQAHNGAQFETGDAVDASSTFSNDECEDDQATHGSVSLGYDGEGDESESKRRKIEAYAADMSGATRAIREPRVVVQTTSEVDILDDGYRWRKYGQKVVKGNPNPRSYYKCTSAGCTVRKHVERASHDLKSVITTYEGKHNHDVPVARNSSHVNSGVSGPMANQSAASAVQAHIHRPESLQVHSSLGRFEGPPSLGAFSLHGRPRLGPSPGFSFRMTAPGLANLAMANLVPGQAKLPMMPVHPFLSQQHQVNELGLMLPKGELKAEPTLEPGSNLSNNHNPSVYQQFMSRLPLGPQM